MYEKDGEKYFIVDSHLHMWNAGPDNWVKGQEQYAKGWIECFHAYQHLGPPETHWPIEKFMSYTHDDFVKDVFEDGGVDYGIFQSTYLEEWYAKGFNNAQLASVATYENCEPGFQQLLAQQDGDLPRFFAAVRVLSKKPLRQRDGDLCKATGSE